MSKLKGIQNVFLLIFQFYFSNTLFRLKKRSIFVEYLFDMIRFSAIEEKVMHLLWHKGKAFMKELIDDFGEPRPAKTTMATHLKRMTDKGYIAYYENGSKREYYPLIKKEAHSTNRVNKLVKDFFNDSAAQLASFCTTETNISTEELKKLRELIDQQIEKKKK